MVLLACVLPGCGTVKEKPVAGSGNAAAESTGTGNPHTPPASRKPPASTGQEADSGKGPIYYRPGTDVFTNKKVGHKQSGTESGGKVTLNLEDTTIAEAAKIILGDLLNVNYTVDHRVQGTVTMQTSKPMKKSALIPALEMLLRMNNATLVKTDGTYKIIPKELALQEASIPQLGDSTAPIPKGFSVRIVPLRYISASEMQKILQPLTRQENLVRVDENRNMLILAGTSDEMSRMLDMVDIFDVDWLKGMSVALFTPEYVDAKTLAEELRKIFEKTPLSDMIRIISVDNLNELLVMSPRKEYLAKVSSWINRLDRNTDVVGRRLYVYKVQNGKASDLADVLGKVFSEGGAGNVPGAEIAPGLEPARLTGKAAGNQKEIVQKNNAKPTGDSSLPPPANGKQQESEPGLVVTGSNNLRIIPDDVNNALVILGTPDQYDQIKSALQKLDVAPLQVLIEATIAEITLTNQFKFGLEWFFNHHTNLPGTDKGTATLDLDSAASLAKQLPGFSYAITDTAGVVRGVLNTLASDSKLNVISSPSLMVLNNQTANIQVGDQVPVTTQQQQATTGQSNVINSIEFRDTGVQLTVTPRVNSGGLVTMDIQQEVSDVAPGSSQLTPTIQQRKIDSTVAVESGETVVLGGLIRENQTNDSSGLPWLHDLPVIGPLFGRTSVQHKRTELVVLITPRAIQGTAAARKITREFRDKMESLKPFYNNKTSTGNKK